LESLEQFHRFLRGGAAEAGLNSGDLNKLDLVLEEILVNVARYAYGGGAGDVEVSYAADSAGLLVEITDRGRSFNPFEAPQPDLDLPLADRPIGGLGVMLVKEIAGSLAYSRENGQNTVSFRFRGTKHGTA